MVISKTTITANGDTTFDTTGGVEYFVKLEDAGGTATATVKDADGDTYATALAEGEGEIYLATGNSITVTIASYSTDVVLTFGDLK